MSVSSKVDTEKLDNLLQSNDSWRRHAYNVMKTIKAGNLASYGCIASIVEKETGNNPGARNIAWLRKKLYEILGHDTDFPLHRIAKVGDIHSIADSDETKKENDKRRKAEGVFEETKWMCE